MSVLSSVLSPVLHPVLGSVLDASSGGAPRFRGIDLDFAQGRYAVNGPYQTTLPPWWSFARTGAGTAQRIDSALVAFAAGFPRITNRGLLPEEQRTNKVTIQNANPVDTTGMVKGGDSASVLSVVNDAGELARSGLSGICTSGRVYRLDNSAGAAVAVASANGATGNTAPHVCSVYARGSGQVRVRLNSVNNGDFRSVTSEYQRLIVAPQTPNNTNNLWSIWAEAGAVVYFILPQLEEGTFATSPIVTEGAAATRGADSASIVLPTGVSSFTAYYGSGQTVSGAVTPGETFDIAAINRPWFNGYLQRLVMQ